MADQLRDAQGNPVVTNETPIRMLTDADLEALGGIYATNNRVDEINELLNRTAAAGAQTAENLAAVTQRVVTVEQNQAAQQETLERHDAEIEAVTASNRQTAELLANETAARIARDNELDQRITQVDQEAQARLTAAQTELTTQITNATTAVNNRVAAVETNIQQQSQLIERVERRNSNLGRNLMVAIGTIVGFAILFGIVGVILMTIDFELLGSTDNWPWVGVVLGLAVGAVVAILLLISATRGNGNTAAAHHA